LLLFERYLEPLRVQAGIPGLSVAIVQDGEILWERGFGHADVESVVAARPDTPYNIGDLTQTLSTLVLAQCAERGGPQPNFPIHRWVPLAPGPPATLRQVLSHTSGSTGGYKYDPARFALLTAVIEACTNLPYRHALSKEMLERLSMLDAVPGRDLAALEADPPAQFDNSWLDRYTANLRRLATPYKVDKRGRATRAEQPAPSIDAAHGAIASVRDLAQFDAALDDYDLVRDDTLQQIWTNVTVNGTAVPMGMGWFVQVHEGQRLVWHFGMVTDAYSALFLRVPARRLTLILLANSDGLSAPFSLSDGDVTSSLFARTFLRFFL